MKPTKKPSDLNTLLTPPFAALFDWDGVVVDSSHQHERSWELLAREIDKPLPPDHFKRGFGKRNAVIIPDILDWTRDPQEIETLGHRKEALYRELVEADGLASLAGVRELLAELRQARVPCVVGTSTERENLCMAFDLLDLGEFFQGTVTSEDVTQGKPHPEVFLRAADLAGLPPEKCVVLEDSVHGIEAARAGGMKALGLATTRPQEHLSEAGAHLVLPSPDQLSLTTLASLWK